MGGEFVPVLNGPIISEQQQDKQSIQASSNMFYIGLGVLALVALYYYTKFIKSTVY